MSRPEEDFALPDNGPQFENEIGESIQSLMDDAPKWDQAYARELAILVRNHVVLRSALMFSLEIARQAELQLRQVGTVEDLKTNQGIIAGLERYASALIHSMTAAEEPEEQDDELEAEE